MMRWIALALGSGVWYLVVFQIAFRWTFPGDAIRDRLQADVYRLSDEAYSLQMSAPSPWWFGLAADDVMLLQQPRSTGEDAAPELLLGLDRVQARVGMFGLIRRAPTVYARLVSGGAAIDAQVDARLEEGGIVEVKNLTLDAGDFPFGDMMAILGPALGVLVQGEGALDLNVEASLPKGYRKADGRATIRGEDIEITSISADTLGGMPVGDMALSARIHEVDIELTATDGRVDVTRGIIRTSLATIQISGDLQLNDDPTRSRLKLDMLVSLEDWKDSGIEGFRGLAENGMAPALWSDGRYHYSVSGTVDNPYPHAERERSGSGSSASSSSSITGSTTSGSSDDRRSRRDLRERLRELGGSETGPAPGAPISPGMTPPAISGGPVRPADALPVDEPDVLFDDEVDDEEDLFGGEGSLEDLFNNEFDEEDEGY